MSSVRRFLTRTAWIVAAAIVAIVVVDWAPWWASLLMLVGGVLFEAWYLIWSDQKATMRDSQAALERRIKNA